MSNVGLHTARSDLMVTEHRHEIGRAMCRQSYFCLLVGAAL